jgi:hypothetical protein
MRRYSPADAHHGDFHHAKQLLGMVFFMDAASVWANKTANSFAGIRPWMPRRHSPMDATPPFAHAGVHLWYKKNNNRNNDKFI